MASPLTITPLTFPTLEESDGSSGEDNLCHVAITGSDRVALCGARIPVASGEAGTPPHRGIVVNGFCTGCSRKICLTCESLNDRELLLLADTMSS